MIEKINVNLLLPHEHNPRKNLGDLTELSESIKVNGILQNLTAVKNKHGTYTIIIGHRRAQAAKDAGLDEVPVAVVEMDERTQLATMLSENMQRTDLTVYEQAQGIQLCMDFGMNEDDIVEKTGLSKPTIRRRVKMLDLDQSKVETAVNATIDDYIKLDEIKDINVKNELLEFIGTNNFNIEVEKALIEQEQSKSKSKDKKQENKTEVLAPADPIIKLSKKLRLDFIKKHFKNKIQGPEVAASVGVINACAITNELSLDNKLLNEIINENNVLEDALLDQMFKHRTNYVIAVAYSLLEYQDNKENLYSYLKELGYEISDDEKGMIDNA